MWQHPLVAGYQQYLHFVGRLLKPPSITNHIVAIIHTKPVIANCIPKLVAMATSLSTSGRPTHDSLGPSEPTTQMASRSVQPSLHKWTQSVCILYNGMPLSPSKLPFPWGDLNALNEVCAVLSHTSLTLVRLMGGVLLLLEDEHPDPF